MTDLLRQLAAPQDRVLLGLLVLVLGYLVLGAIVARQSKAQSGPRD